MSHAPLNGTITLERVRELLSATVSAVVASSCLILFDHVVWSTAKQPARKKHRPGRWLSPRVRQCRRRAAASSSVDGVAKDTGKHRGMITRTAESVFGALMYLTEKYGRVFPSLEGLAHLAMCCKQLVVTAIADLEKLGFCTRIRRVRQVQTPLGFRTEQITNAYVVHEPTSGLGLLATLVFATESNSWTASAHIVESFNGAGTLNPANPLHRALERLGTLLESRKGAAPNGAAKGLPM